MKKVSTWKGVVTIIVVAIVLVGGALLYQNFIVSELGNVFAEPQNPQETLPPNIQTSTTTSWKTYKNDEYGFEFQYPENRYFGDQKDVLPVSSDTACSSIQYAVPVWGTASIEPMVIPVIVSNSEWFKLYIVCANIDSIISKPICVGNGNECGELGEEKTITQVGNISGYQYIGGIPTTNSFNSVTFAKLNNDKTLELEFGGDYDKDMSALNQILSTFKFTK